MPLPFQENLSEIYLGEVDHALADGSIVLSLTNGDYALMPAAQVDVAKIASDVERRGNLRVAR